MLTSPDSDFYDVGQKSADWVAGQDEPGIALLFPAKYCRVVTADYAALALDIPVWFRLVLFVMLSLLNSDFQPKF